jgi:hypothetical protein
LPLKIYKELLSVDMVEINRMMEKLLWADKLSAEAEALRKPLLRFPRKS